MTIKQLDAALVAYLGLGGAARKIQLTLQSAGLRPPPNTGTEAVARMLQLRLNHPAGEDDLELLPYQPATRAEAAWSFAQVLHLGEQRQRVEIHVQAWRVRGVCVGRVRKPSTVRRLPDDGAGIQEDA